MKSVERLSIMLKEVGGPGPSLLVDTCQRFALGCHRASHASPKRSLSRILALAPPTLREGGQRGFECHRETVCRGSVALLAVGQRPHPWPAGGRRDGPEVDAADDLAVAQLVVIVRALQTACERAEDQVIHPAVFFDRPASVLLFRDKELFADDCGGGGAGHANLPEA